MKKTTFLVITFFTSFFAFGQINVAINSGNPRFPFPQFSSYSYGQNHELENLSTETPVGVTHAEMKQRIRDAWQIMANRFE